MTARTPSYTDRILLKAPGVNSYSEMVVEQYGACGSIASSDHAPVFAALKLHVHKTNKVVAPMAALRDKLDSFPLFKIALQRDGQVTDFKKRFGEEVLDEVKAAVVPTMVRNTQSKRQATSTSHLMFLS